MAKKNANGVLMKSDLKRLRDGLGVVIDAGYGCSDLAIQAARNFRRVSEEFEDLEKTREPRSKEYEEYGKAEAALFKKHGETAIGGDGKERTTVPKEKQPELVKDLEALQKKFSKALEEQNEKNKKFDEKAKKTKADVQLRKVSEGLIKKEVPKFSTRHALGILEMIDE